MRDRSSPSRNEKVYTQMRHVRIRNMATMLQRTKASSKDVEFSTDSKRQFGGQAFQELPVEQDRFGVWKSLWLGLALWLVYSANLGAYYIGDAFGATLLPVSVVRGDGVALDRFEWLIRENEGGVLPIHFEHRRGHLVSLYPLAPGLILTPLVWPQVYLLDRLSPSWESGPKAAQCLRMMAKNAVAVLVAVTGVGLMHLLLALGLSRLAAWFTVLTVSVGSTLWVVASQAAWQHGPSALFLTLAMLVLSTRHVSTHSLVTAGLAAGLMVVMRPTNVIFALALSGWVGWEHRRRAIAFLIPLAGMVSVLVASNIYLFGGPLGGQSLIESHHPRIHRTASPWSGDLVTGAAGTLLSPSHGLFIYCPWTLLAIASLGLTTRRLPPRSVAHWLLWALLPFGLTLSKYSVWWGGWSFGPRYWTDAMPILAIPFGFGLDWAARQRRFLLPIFVAAGISAIGIEAVGAACYPSSWFQEPTNVDRDHARLWDWRDTELSRCLAEGPRSWPLRRVLAYLGLCKDVSSRTTSGRQTQHPQSTQPARRRSMSLFYPSLSPECYVAGAVVKLGPLGSDPAKPKRPRQDALIGFVSRER